MSSLPNFNPAQKQEEFETLNNKGMLTPNDYTAYAQDIQNYANTAPTPTQTTLNLPRPEANTATVYGGYTGGALGSMSPEDLEAMAANPGVYNLNSSDDDSTDSIMSQFEGADVFNQPQLPQPSQEVPTITPQEIDTTIEQPSEEGLNKVELSLENTPQEEFAQSQFGGALLQASSNFLISPPKQYLDGQGSPDLPRMLPTAYDDGAIYRCPATGVPCGKKSFFKRFFDVIKTALGFSTTEKTVLRAQRANMEDPISMDYLLKTTTPEELEGIDETGLGEKVMPSQGSGVQLPRQSLPGMVADSNAPQFGSGASAQIFKSPYGSGGNSANSPQFRSPYTNR